MKIECHDNNVYIASEDAEKSVFTIEGEDMDNNVVLMMDVDDNDTVVGITVMNAQEHFGNVCDNPEAVKSIIMIVKKLIYPSHYKLHPEFESLLNQ